MPTISRRGNKYKVRWDEYDQDGNRIQRQKDFERRTEAREFAHLIEDDKIPRLEQKQCFREYAREWWQLYQHEVEHATFSAYAHIVDQLAAHFGKRELSAIRVSDVERYYRGLSVSANTVRHYHAVLRLIFAYAERDGIISSNPAAKARLPKLPDRELPQPDISDVRARLEELRGTPYFTGVCIAFYAGLRRSEICGLKWSDVDFAAETLTVRRVRERYVEGAPLNEYTHIIDMPGKPQIERESTKSGHIRTFIVPHELIEILKSEQQSQRINRLKWGQKYFTSDYVCVASDGAPVSANGLSKCMRGVCRLHDLRHLNVTYQIDAGIPIPEVARRAGHTTSQTTMKVYAHALTKQDKTAADALSRALGALK